MNTAVATQFLDAAMGLLECHVNSTMHQQIAEEALRMNDALAEAMECGRCVAREVERTGESTPAARARLSAALKVVKEMLA